MSKTGDVRPLHLRVSERSNALQFSRSFFFGANNPLNEPSWARNTTKAYSYLRTIDEARSKQNPIASEKQRKALADTDPNSRPKLRFTSLLPPIQNTILKANSKRLSSSASIRSFASSIGRKRKYSPPANLTTLPTEIIDEIAKYCDQKTLHSLLLTAKRCTDPAAEVLYQAPTFASTYRFAQFVHAINRRRYYASKVREINLAAMVANMDPEEAVAGWREWKYRNDPIHTLHKEKGMSQESIAVYPNEKKPLARYGKRMRRWSKATSKKPTITISEVVDSSKSSGSRNSTHPRPSNFLEQFHLSRDVPLGFILHLLAACPSLRILDLSNVQLSEDYTMSTKIYPCEAFTGLLFVSDTPRRPLWNQDEIINRVTASVHLRPALTKMQKLEVLKLAGATWLSKDDARKIVNECRGLKRIDLRGCGMRSSLSWAVEADVEKLRNDSVFQDWSSRKS